MGVEIKKNSWQAERVDQPLDSYHPYEYRMCSIRKEQVQYFITKSECDCRIIRSSPKNECKQVPTYNNTGTHR